MRLCEHTTQSLQWYNVIKQKNSMRYMKHVFSLYLTVLNWFPWEIVVLIYVSGHSWNQNYPFLFCKRMRIFDCYLNMHQTNASEREKKDAKGKRKIYIEKFVHRFYINGNIYMYFVLAENTRKAPCITRTTNNRGSTIWKQGNTKQPRGKTLLQRNKLESPSPKDSLWQV